MNIKDYIEFLRTLPDNIEINSTSVSMGDTPETIQVNTFFTYMGGDMTLFCGDVLPREEPHFDVVDEILSGKVEAFKEA